VRRVQFREQRRGTRKLHGVAGFDGSAAERNGQMRFGNAWWTQEHHVFGIGDIAAGRQLANEPLIDGRLELELELVECLDDGEARNLHAHLDASTLPCGNLVAEQPVEKLEIRRLSSRCFGEGGIEAKPDALELESLEMLEDTRMNDIAHDDASSKIAA
jgi:hypothetical protein